MIIGKIYLIGAGPGDPGLITVKAKNALNSCDVVVYDHLVSMELIVTLPSHVQRIYAGKSAGKHHLPQDEINGLLLKLASEGKTVARLKGGDPFVFGRGGEEALFLREHGVKVEIIPGLTAGTAALSGAGIPLTHRNLSSYAILLTAHEAMDKEQSDLPFKLLIQTEKGTIVGYMGVKTLPVITEKLLTGGMDGETPAAVIERGTLRTQRVIVGTLYDIAEKASQASVSPPALFVIGDVVKLRNKIVQTDDKPLAGKTIMVTRPAHQGVDMYRRLRELGAEPLALPTINVDIHFAERAWSVFKVIDEGILVFTSENGVNCFFRCMMNAGLDRRRLGRFAIAAVGHGTGKALMEHGISADFIPSKFTVQTLAEELLDKFDWEGTNVVRVRGSLGEPIIENTLKEAGANVLPLQVYTTTTAVWDEGMFAAYREAKIDAVTFTSGSTITGLREILGEDEFQRFLASTPAISIGPMTSEVLRGYGGEPAVEAEVHSIEGVVEALFSHFNVDKGLV